jgi:hypothetical protein
MILNQEQWERTAPELPGKVGDPSYDCEQCHFG